MEVANRVTAAQNKIANGPAIHPNCAMLHASDSTPAPITAVITCATAVHIVPFFPISEYTTKKDEPKPKLVLVSSKLTTPSHKDRIFNKIKTPFTTPIHQDRIFNKNQDTILLHQVRKIELLTKSRHNLLHLFSKIEFFLKKSR